MTAPPQDIPRGRLGRLARLAGLGLRSSAGKLVSGDAASSARHAAEVLGNLRGLAAKVGQMASYVDGFMPSAHSELYGAVLGKLQSAAPTSAPAAIRSIIEQELRAPVHELFAHWEDEPVASASLGQVHRATLHDGRAVAVKVQHPFVDQALEGDLKNVATLESLFRPLVGQKVDSKSIVAVLCARFREELDYTLEAQRQRGFARVHQGDPNIHVPAVIDERSSRRVLTSEFVHGVALEQAALASEAVRRSYAETMWRFVFRGNFIGKMFNADPHPGNYIFQPAGKVAFLDFGCVQALTPHMHELGLRQYIAALEGDDRAFSEATAQFYRADYRPLIEHTRHCFEPMFTSPFRITREYAGGLLAESAAVAKTFKGKSEGPPELPLFNRLQFGLYSVLARLDVEADYAGMSRTVLAEVTSGESHRTQESAMARPA